MSFYQTAAWRTLRRQVLALYGYECMSCGEYSNMSHVDHIIPRSVDESLELDLTNLQILCENCNCNIKGTHIVDYRTDKHIKLIEHYTGRKVSRAENKEEKEKREEQENIVAKEIISKKRCSSDRKKNTIIKNYDRYKTIESKILTRYLENNNLQVSNAMLPGYIGGIPKGDRHRKIALRLLKDENYEKQKNRYNDFRYVLAKKLANTIKVVVSEQNKIISSAKGIGP